MRLLYVDDDRINALLFRPSCRLARALEVQSAESGRVTLDIAPRGQRQSKRQHMQPSRAAQQPAPAP